MFSKFHTSKVILFLYIDFYHLPQLAFIFTKLLFVAISIRPFTPLCSVKLPGSAYLAQSPQLYKQMALCADFDKVFTIGAGQNFLVSACSYAINLTSLNY